MDEVNGGNKEMHYWRESTDSEKTANSSHDDSIASLSFRGFDKQPKVLLERIDIEPYLQKSWKTKKLKHDLSLLLSDCFVKLAREDLKLLQQQIRENARQNDEKSKGILKTRLLHCKVCEKGYNSEKKLKNHLENKHLLVYKAVLAPNTLKKKKVSFSEHVIVHEMRKYHKCRKCPKIFERYQFLKTHMKEGHRKRTCYICHYCSKDFVDRMFFKIHIKQHCDICGKFFPNKRNFFQHRLTSCRVAKTYACKTCKKTFYSQMDLKDHSYDHMKGIHVCDICQAQHQSKCAVAIHIMFFHSSKTKELFSCKDVGNERVYVCNFCNVSSLDRNVMDRHVSMLPDAEDDYSCDQCLRRFVSETSMLQHKWSHYLKTHSQVQRDVAVKTRFKISEELPRLMQPRIVLERLDLTKLGRSIDNNNTNSEDKNENQRNLEKSIDTKSKDEINGVIDTNQKEADISVRTEMDVSQEVNSVEVIPESVKEISPPEITTHEVSVIVKKAIVDPKSKKTLISQFQCEKCHKFFSNNYGLKRHKARVHTNFESVACNICEQTFLWPSLFNAHKCSATRMGKRFEYDNYREFGSDELMNISESEDCMNGVDFDIPAPIQLAGYNSNIINNASRVNNYGSVNSSYKIVMQEVPIEF